ncbi:hypothetical protein ES288_D13G052500v1 [Gossypium darwinii]|uniref:Uncharacterized protein n=1 Tax=Gossypium darwinii TaxID=34276 RepID=A0A5D1ZW16_GOSDA|nr:hypothetical protein ES288_D13G052500v1 [Gossypium darwinii]
MFYLNAHLQSKFGSEDWEVSKWRLRRVQAPIMADQTVHGTNAVVMEVVAFVTAVPKSFAVGSLRRES